ncbi:hypothetical protein SAMCFNEI73_Ch3579 [Sinorhizobium americanum]|uniref:Uncharacterized protein n=1 Tax=Sinorhizobium americanum TaxID=194963 RepID=A0A1L3LRW3_9HYPH|nr:hypothetical protein SAMCFNEI73_Ch3579 [Sinorhizobium americanum]
MNGGSLPAIDCRTSLPARTGSGAECSRHIACHGINLSGVGLMRH